MIQSKTRLLELNAKLAEHLTSKGVTATADETTTSLVNKVADITSGDDSVLRGLIQREATEMLIPDGITRIGKNAFSYMINLKSIIISKGVTLIGENGFFRCENLKSAEFPDSLEEIGICAFMYCFNLSEIILPDGLKTIRQYAFSYCGNANKLVIPSSVTLIENYAFIYTNRLKYVTLGENFDCDNLNLSSSTLFSRETIISWLNALADRTGQTAYKLTIGATNLAKLTEEDILIATNKNWTLA